MRFQKFIGELHEEDLSSVINGIEAFHLEKLRNKLKEHQGKPSV